jgi:beta-phosphoglucomutase-like phosphatase (HAD superfamily)
LPITTILCDLDGTLVDSRLDIAMAFQHAWQTVIGGTPPSATVIAEHIGKPSSELHRVMLIHGQSDGNVKARVILEVVASDPVDGRPPR